MDWLTELFLSTLRSLGGSILSGLGLGGVIAVLAGGLLLLAVPLGLIRFVSRPRGMAMAAAVLLGGLAMMLRGSTPMPPVTNPQPMPPSPPVVTNPQPVPSPPAADPVPEQMVSFERPGPAAEGKPPNATCGNCGADFYASWNSKTRCPRCGFVMDAERAMQEKVVSARPDLTSDWFLKSLEHDRQMAELKRQWDERDRPKREAAKAKEREILRWKAYFIDHLISKSLDFNGHCIHCRNEFKTPNKGRKLFMPCPRCFKEAVTWRAVEKPDWQTPMWSYNQTYKSLDEP